jgi:hypothetical protein
MDKIPKGLVSEYRWYRSHSQTVSALVLADRIAELLERSGDRETLAEMKAKLVGGFYTGDPEARNSALGEFTRLALDVMSSEDTTAEVARERKEARYAPHPAKGGGLGDERLDIDQVQQVATRAGIQPNAPPTAAMHKTGVLGARRLRGLIR